MEPLVEAPFMSLPGTHHRGQSIKLSLSLVHATGVNQSGNIKAAEYDAAECFTSSTSNGDPICPAGVPKKCW
jgi:hypothetical protein